MMPVRVTRIACALERDLVHRPVVIHLTDGSRCTSVKPNLAAVSRTLLLRSLNAASASGHRGHVCGGHVRQRQVFLQKWVGLPIGRRLSGRPRGPNDEQDPDKAVEVVGQSAYVSESLQHDDVSKVSGGASSKDETATEGVVANSGERRENDDNEASMWQRAKTWRSNVKTFWKRYGIVSVGTYLVSYFVGGAGIYGMLASGLVDVGMDVNELVQFCAEFTGSNKNELASPYIKSFQHYVQENPQHENIFMAIVINEFLDLPRELLVIFATPSIARALGRAPAKVPRKGN